MDTRLFVLTNCLLPPVFSGGYIPLYLGTGWKHTPGALYEDTGENLSDKHKYYADLGGFYWIWKNIQCDIAGICQYRKYFFSEHSSGFISTAEIENILQDYDIIVPPAFTSYEETVWDKYKNHQHIQDLMIARDILSEKYPEYLDGFQTIMDGYRLYGLNMWISRKETFDSYCRFIFPILQEAELRIDTTNYSEDMQRVLAFLSEWLFSTWLLHQPLRVYEIPPLIIGKKGEAPDADTIREYCPNSTASI